MEAIEAILVAIDAARKREPEPAVPPAPRAPPSSRGEPMRFRVTALATAAPGVAKPSTPIQPQPQPQPQPRPVTRTRGLLAAFRSGEGLITGIVAAEVFSPPLALREGEGAPFC
jgi:hypothetical protein